MKRNIKNTILLALKLLLLVCLFISIYVYTREVLRDKSASEALNIIIDQPDGTYDVIFAGSSHMQYAMQPAQLFGEYGISSCNASTAAQSVPTTYYVLKELIRRHDPEMVVVDLFMVFYPELYQSKARMHQALDNLPFSLNKIAAIEDLLETEKEEFYINYLLYHGRWKSLEEFDYQFHEFVNEKYQYLANTMPFENDFVPVPVDETEELPQGSGEYLKKIVDLCKETNTQLLLTVVPWRADVDNNGTPALIQQRMYNMVEVCAEQWGVDYLNGLHCLNEMGFDFTTDMSEYSHVNLTGARKITSYYGALLKENYLIPDRSQDPSYADWYEDYHEYLKL